MGADVMPGFEGIDHVVLRVRDVERMLAFYVDALGCTLERTREDIGLYQLRAGDGLIDLLVDGGPQPRAKGALSAVGDPVYPAPGVASGLWRTEIPSFGGVECPYLSGWYNRPTRL